LNGFHVARFDELSQACVDDLRAEELYFKKKKVNVKEFLTIFLSDFSRRNLIHVPENS
jgi:hypothetical protein